jgi:hypothetical protein
MEWDIAALMKIPITEAANVILIVRVDGNPVVVI